MKKIVLIILSVYVCVSMSGCAALDFVGVLSTPTYGEQKIPAEYDLKANSKDGIIVYVEPSVGSGVGVVSQTEVANMIKGYLVQRAKIKGEYINPQTKVSLSRIKDDKLEGLSPVQIGKKLSAGLVLHVRIENYRLYQMSGRGYYSGSMTTRSMIYDVESGNVVWPADGNGKVNRTQVELELNGQKATSDRLIRAMGYCVVRNLFNCVRNQYRIKDEVEDYSNEKYW
jgi:hypothetical protein